MINCFAKGVDEIRVSIVDGSELPNVRLLSNMFFEKQRSPSLEVNMLVAHWAHFIYTDLVHIGSLQLLQGTFLNVFSIACLFDYFDSWYVEIFTPVLLERSTYSL